MLMSLQLIYGPSGSGKSYTLYKKIIEQSIREPDREFIVIVPEQFTMQTQRELVELHPNRGILNIDVQSFLRLAWRIFEEVGVDTHTVLEDTGKNLLLRRVASRQKNDLTVLGRNFRKPGYISQVKSIISELKQYDVSLEELDEQLRSGKKDALSYKLQDIRNLYEGFQEELQGKYITSEEILEELCYVVKKSQILKGCVVALDGFTGFTPIQNKLLRELMQTAEKIYVTVTLDAWEDPMKKVSMHKLSYLSKKTIQQLAGAAKECGCMLEKPEVLGKEGSIRFRSAPALRFLERHLFRPGNQIYEAQDSQKLERELSLHVARDAKAEAEFAARTIWHLVREENLRYRDIAVITGDMESFGDHMKKELQQKGIPCFIDRTRKLLLNPLVEFLRAALQIAAKSFRYESMFRYLRTGLAGLKKDEIDQLENYVLALGIRGFKKWDEVWVRIYRGMPPENIQRLNEIRERFADETRELALSFKGGKKTVREYCTILYEFALKSQVQQKLKHQELKFKEQGDKAMEKEYAQIYGIVMELLDNMVEILGEETVSRQDFRQLLETGLNQAKVALIPPSMDQVLVGDMERTRLKDIRALFFVGVNEGNIPKNTSGGGILTELDREFFQDQGIQLAPGPKELMNTQRFYLYLNMTKPRELLCLSFCQSDSQGKALSPAFLINNIREMFPEMEIRQCGEVQDSMELLELPGISLDYLLKGLAGEEYRDDVVFQELYSWYLQSPEYRTLVKRLTEVSFSERPSDMIGKTVAGILYGEVSPYSATRLERFAACAFAHFLQYGLKVTERAEYEFRAMDMGNVMHMALEKFAAEVRKEGLNWAELTEEERNRIIDSCLDQVSADYGNTILKSSARNEYMIERTRRILRRTVWALQEQLKHGAFRPEGFEVRFQGGRIDRVDIMEEPENNRVYVKVIDYKTGNTSFDLLALYHGLQLQLMVYLDGALQVEKRKYPDREIVPAGVFYYNVKDPMIQEKIHADMESINEQMLKKMKMNGLVQADDNMSTKIDSTMASIPVSLNRDGSFSKRSSVASRKQFDALGAYVRRKICDIRESILDGNAAVEPYELGKKNACTYCPYLTVCGFDRKIPGYEFHRMSSIEEDALWKKIMKGEEENGSEMD